MSKLFQQADVLNLDVPSIRSPLMSGWPGTSKPSLISYGQQIGDNYATIFIAIY